MTAMIVRGDARRLPLPDACVDLIVTSPPYWSLRSYTDGGEHYEGQLGSESTPAEYIDALIECTREWVRCLKPEGSLFINLGDKFSTGNSGQSGLAELGKRWTGGGHSDGKAKLPSPAVAGWPPKSLLGLPWRYALACTDQLGLILRRDIVWSKPNGLPESVTDRCRSAHEYVFHLVRQPRYYSAVDEIRLPAVRDDARAGGHRYSGEIPGIGRKHQGLTTQPNHPLGTLPGSVWSIPSQPLAVPPSLGVDHFAAFPVELPRRIIAGWSPPGVCCECGQGRRPVAHQTDAAYAAERARVRESKKRTEREKALGATFGNLGGRTNSGGYSNISNGVVRPVYGITGYACACPAPDAPARPALICDPFCGTGTTLLAATALGRNAIGTDLSADYVRLARWRIADPGERAKAMHVPRPEPVSDDQLALFG